MSVVYRLFVLELDIQQDRNCFELETKIERMYKYKHSYQRLPLETQQTQTMTNKIKDDVDEFTKMMDGAEEVPVPASEVIR